MSRRTKQFFAAFFCVSFLAFSASAGPEGRNESRDWLTRQIDRIVQTIKKIVVYVPLDDSQPLPPHP